MEDIESKNEKKLPHRYQKGWKGGPGRPVGSKNKVTVFLEHMGAEEIERVLSTMKELALKGCPVSCKYLLDRFLPSRKGTRMAVPGGTEGKTTEELNKVSERIMAMIGEGELSAEEAIDIQNAIEKRIKVMTDTDIMKKIEEAYESVKKNER